MRITKIKATLENNDSYPYLIFSLQNIRYLTGFKGSNGYLLIDKNNIFFITDSRYEEYAKSILPENITFILQNKSMPETIKNLTNQYSIKKIFLEKHSITLSAFLKLKDTLSATSLIPADDYVNQLRIIKDDQEIKILRKAAQITDKCVQHLISIIKPGLSEWDIVLEIELFYKKNGCKKTSFDSIVASGPGASMPHYEPSDKKILNNNEMVLIDMGCLFKGYNSDLTRTFFLNSVTSEFTKIYSIVKDAQILAINNVKSGQLTCDIDKTAREYIENAGYGDYFGHSLGHGIGIDVHELPAVNSSGDFRLEKNVIISIEPGIYIPGKGGVRIEDMIRVTETGCEVLTHSPKDLIVIK